MKKGKRLKLKQELFADWYIKLGNATAAAIKAGYAKRSATVTASRMLTNTNIQAYIAKRKTELEELLGFNKATIAQDFLTIKNKSMQAQPVMTYDREARQYAQVTEMNEEGKEVGVYQYDSIGANRALENVNKMMGYNAAENVKHSNDPDNPMPADNVIIYLPDNGRDTKDATAND